MSRKPDHLDPKIAAGWESLRAEAERGPPKRSRTVARHLRDEKRQTPKVDGRTLRTTGRNQQLNVRVKAATKTNIKKLADANGWLIGEVIEHAVIALRDKLDRQK